MQNLFNMLVVTFLMVWCRQPSIFLQAEPVSFLEWQGMIGSSEKGLDPITRDGNILCHQFWLDLIRSKNIFKTIQPMVDYTITNQKNGITSFFLICVLPISEGEDLKTTPLMVSLWCSSMDNILPSVLCSHLLHGHQRCFPSVSSARTAATMLTQYWHNCPQLQQKMCKGVARMSALEETWKATSGNISPSEACLRGSQLLLPPISFLLLLFTFPILSTHVRSSEMPWE